MNLENNYWYFTSALSNKFCDEVLKYGKSFQSQLARTGSFEDKDELSKDDLNNLQKKRKSELVWLSDRWIYNEIHPFVNAANASAGWNFEWDFSEACQFTKYGVDDHYGWHCDSWTKPYDSEKGENYKDKIRKLSVTISLSDPNDYEGGNLEFDFRNQIDWENNKTAGIKECFEIRPRGSIIVFPSFVWHRVKPVTQGTRYSLVIWNIGRPFK